jgi:UDP-N-acetylmuramoyl-L-alanyl-D-glutamate--2,6-diaminopimelate ligase
MTLRELFEGEQVKLLQGSWEASVSGFDFDSRKIKQGDLFVAVKGTAVDGHKFIEKGINKGATSILLEEAPEVLAEGVNWLICENSREVLSALAANFYGRPAEKLKIVGVTGTNGKTTSATLLHRVFAELGHPAGLISTIQYMVGEEVFPSSHTTPDPKQLHTLFAQMVEKGCEYCFMEVSSHALSQGRVSGIPFKVALFTNITHDHLDYHGSFKAYIEAKKRLFDELEKDAVAIVNVDDRNGQVMVQNTRAKAKSYALKRMADYKGKLLENTFEGIRMEIDGEEAWFRMRGSFNAYNLLMIYAAGIELGIEQEELLKAMSLIEGVEGRFQVIRSKDQKTAIVDYAHTPDALKNVLDTILDVDQGQHKVFTVVGCGGNRDKEKRPIMGKIAAEASAQVILTSDNPRDEEPETIIDEMYAGIPDRHLRKVLRNKDRREAIRTACMLAQPGDIILVAGKGHETYQEIKGVKHPFDDRKVLIEALTVN